MAGVQSERRADDYGYFRQLSLILLTIVKEEKVSIDKRDDD